MGKTIVVGIADLNVALNDDIIITYALGSCVGICLYDPVRKIAGLSHIMLPDSKLSVNAAQPHKYADSAIPALIKRMEMQGAMRSALKAKIAGGAKMFATSGNSDIANIGERNIAAVKKTLASLRIPILVADVGENFGRTQSFDPQTGLMKIKSANKGEWVL